jgi:3-(3-hydroxy-phenyl)propionate hydroxylase
VIVGFGPTGAVASALLGQYGLSVLVCDSQTEVYDKPRAIALDHEIMRVFQQIGILEDIAPFIEPFTDSHFFGAQGQLIKIMSTVPPPYPQGFPPSLVFTQPAIERALRRAVGKIGNVTVALGTSFSRLKAQDCCVDIELSSAASPAINVEAKYLIACDGASSTVRKSLDIAWTDLGFDQAWLVVDTLLNRQGLKKLPKVSFQICEPARPSTMVIGPGMHRRWEFAINPNEDPKQLETPEGTWKLLSRWLLPTDAKLWRQASYRFHALVAERWQVGRVFLVGDAAHQQPPFLGQGMCQGIRDAANLAWKIAAVLRDGASEKILASYESERKAHVTELTSRIKHIGELVGERDPAKATLRDQKLLNEHSGTVKPTPRQNVQPPIGAGLRSALAHPALGTLFPQPWMIRANKKHRLDELLGCGWRLILANDASKSLCLIANQAQSEHLAFCRIGSKGWHETEGVLENWFKQNQCKAVLLRPDHYVYGTAETPQQLQDMLDQLK